MEMFDVRKKNSFEALKSKFNFSNVMQTPKIEKVIVSVGIGSVSDKKKRALIEERLMKITGQKPVGTKAKKSIATFKLREGEVIGYQVTLRGKRMESFLDKLIHIALPRTKDFRGISPDAIDEMGNYTLGVKEHTIFPETSDEDVKDVFGMAITIVTGTGDKEKTRALFEHLGFPFKKEE
ncbi:MAG: 50S ribosomal protein L5 [Candidatus Pacebacteria bacterium]|nr:50S ribosomal protein L5 [Candidatus Paceibacterota bacterium]